MDLRHRLVVASDEILAGTWDDLRAETTSVCLCKEDRNIPDVVEDHDVATGRDGEVYIYDLTESELKNRIWDLVSQLDSPDVGSVLALLEWAVHEKRSRGF